MKYNPLKKKHVEKVIDFSIKAYADQRTFLRIIKNVAFKHGWEITFQERLDRLNDYEKEDK